MKLWERIKDDIRNDVNWNRATHLVVQGYRALPLATAQYIREKLPIIDWLPRYYYRWLVNDVIAGLTVGLLLIPQALSYAKIGAIPIQYGLMSSWLPGALYVFMGTTKDVSTGPTSLIGLLTAEVVVALQGEYTPSQIASAMAMMMGVYSMCIGLLQLGFLLEFISLPILTGFASAVAMTIILNQISSLLGEPSVGGSTAQRIHGIFRNLPKANGFTCAVGLTGIVLLVVLQQLGKRWGDKSKIIWFLSTMRALLCLVLYTGVSYAVNRNRGDPDNFLFAVSEVHANGLERPRIPDVHLIAKVAGRTVTLFAATAVEHTAIARTFAVQNNYVADQSQELFYLGVTNFLNSFFSAMGVGGAMSRTAVNSSCNVKSPLSGLITTCFLLLSIYKLVRVLYWIPKATLAANIITAVAPLIAPPSTFYKYWKTSLADFISCMLAFWVSLFATAEIGLVTSVAFNVAYCIGRQVFAPVSTVGYDTMQGEDKSQPEVVKSPTFIPPNVRIFRFTDSFYFPNAYAIKSHILDVIQTFHAPSCSTTIGSEPNRGWSVVAEKRTSRLRRRENIFDISTLPPIQLVVFDFTKVNHTDATAVAWMRNLFEELKKYAGNAVEVRFVGMSDYVRRRFERGGFEIMDENCSVDGTGDDADVVWYYQSVVRAVYEPRRRVGDGCPQSIQGDKEDE
ncbi:hypothetical protein ACO22_07615 [Paracoccidioides brasiliensis]|uniref:STAS domain-containing protein n=1 Tax=Paracoccidioides brasiliensis TaxID=121759 RepID=A0A1D2J492_PARBR|nr:hypothetical protein ACO22_07615 [Paracoccidioides brasiliensis]